MMKFKLLKSGLLVFLTIFASVLAFFGPLSNNPVVPEAHAAPPNNPPILGLFSESKKSNSLVDATIGNSALFTMDVNVTDAGLLNAFDINLTVTSASIVWSSSAINGAGCPASDRVIAGSPSSGQTLKSDPHIKFVATLSRGTGWAPDARDSVVYDANNNGLYDTGDTVTFGITPSPPNNVLSSDPAIKYFDTNGNNVWNAGEPVVLDPNGDNVYDTVPRCLFDRLSPVNKLFNGTSNPPGLAGRQSYRLSVVDADTSFPFVNGNGILFRVTFRTAAAGVATVIHIFTKASNIYNPSSVTYNQIDGFFDSRASPSNYAISVTPTATVLRKVSGTNTTTATVNIGTPTNVGTITLSALGLPQNTNAVFTPPTCAAACSSTLTITINGGPKGASGTTPSGSYFIPVIGNSTATGATTNGNLIRASWLLLTVKPPKPPVFTVTVTPRSYSQESGNVTFLAVSVTLTSGANDSIVLGQNCPNRLQGGLCSFQPSFGPFPLSATMNVTTNPSSTAPGTYRFNATATTQGTYSEVVITQNVTLTMTVIRTHDVSIQTVAVASRSFGYNGVSPSFLGVNPAGAPAVKIDAKIKYIDLNSNNVYDAGEPVVYDNNANGIYDIGEPVICCVGSIVMAGQALKTDSEGGFNLIKYMDFNGNNLWDMGEEVVKDANNNGLFDITEPQIGGIGPMQISVSASNLGTVSDTYLVNATARVVLNNNDCRLGFVDANANNIYDTGEIVILDSDCNGRYGSGSTDPRIRFIGAGATWASGNTVVIDADFSGTYDNSVFSCSFGICSGVDQQISAGVPTFEQALTTAAGIKFVNATNTDQNWVPGRAVVNDTNANNIYDAGEPVIFGTPTVGQKLQLDTLIKFADTNGNGRWDPGEPVAYDTSNNGIYDPDYVISGIAPANGTALKSDPKLLFVDDNRNGQWDPLRTPPLPLPPIPAETVFYDTNGNAVYDSGETLIIGTAPALETVLFGTAPVLATLLNANKMSYTDTSLNSARDLGESIVWDSNNNGLYDAGEPVPVPGSNPPSAGILLNSATLTLAPGVSAVVNLGWDPSTLARGKYLIGGYASLVTSSCPASPCEFNKANNFQLIQAYTQRLKGDTNVDCKITINDILAVQGKFQATASQPNFLDSTTHRPDQDFNNDGAITINDVLIVNGVFSGTGSSC